MTKENSKSEYYSTVTNLDSKKNTFDFNSNFKETVEKKTEFIIRIFIFNPSLLTG